MKEQFKREYCLQHERERTAGVKEVTCGWLKNGRLSTRLLLSTKQQVLDGQAEHVGQLMASTVTTVAEFFPREQ